LQKQSKFKVEFDKRVKNHHFRSDCKIEAKEGDEEIAQENDDEKPENIIGQQKEQITQNLPEIGNFMVAFKAKQV
tara:strand:- start:114 stop:338 length:225 start_codon:yes stop_codon:yes gene_type:complete